MGGGGGGGGFDIGAFNPFADWKHKNLLDKFGALSGLPIGGAIASPKWIKKHPKEAAAAAAVAATVFSGGAAAGLWGGLGAGAGATAGGLTAAEAAAGGAGAGAGAWGGAALADGVATGAGAGAWGGAALADGAMAAPLVTEAAAPAAYGGELASVGDSGGTMLGGAQPQELKLGSGIDWMRGLRGANFANGLFHQSSPQQTPMPRQERPPPAPTRPLTDSLKPIYGDHEPRPGDPDYIEYMRRKYANGY